MNVTLSEVRPRLFLRACGAISPVWVHGLLVLLCTLVGLACLLLAVRWVDRPFPGFLLSSDRSIHAMWRREWPGFRVGLDPSYRLLAADGNPVTSSHEAYALLEGRTGHGPVQWRFVAAGRERALTFPVQRLTWGDLLAVFLPPFLAGAFMLGVAAWVVWTHPTARAARVYLLIASLAAVADFALFDSATDYVFTDLWVIAIALSAAPLLHLGLIFPCAHPLLMRVPWLETVPYVVMLLLVAVSQVCNTWYFRPELARGFFVWEITAPSLAVLVLIGLLFHSWSLAGSPRTRRQVEIVGLGILAGFGSPAAWSIAFARGQAFGNLSLIMACFAAFPLSIGYAIVRHQLFEIGEAIRRLSAYTGVTLIMGGGYLAAVGLAVPFLQARWLPAPVHWAFQPLLVVLAGAVIRPLHSLLQRTIDRYFYPGRYQRERRIAAFFRDLQHGISVEELVPALQKLLTDTFATVSSAILLGTGEEEATARPAWTVLSVPMVIEKRLVGYIYLGQCLSGGEYAQEDLDLLAMVATSGAIAVERARYASQAIDLAVQHHLIRDRAALMERLNAIVNHELKGPLQLIRRMAADVQVEWPPYWDDRPPERLAVTVARIGAVALRLEKFVQRNLDRSALQANQLRPNLEPISASALAQELVEGFRPEWERRPLSVDLDLPPYLPAVLADRDKLEHVMENLLTNALKYTPPGGSVHIKGRTDGRVLYLHVRDSGRGIASCDQERVFEPFGRPDGANRASTGLGLSICQEYMHVMQGRIRLSSRPGQGSTFTLIIPAA